MLSPEELKDGMTFILQLEDTSGASVQWVETLRGDIARRWYDIYRRSDWEALQSEAADVFHRRVSDAELQSVRKARQRCVFVHTPAVQRGRTGAGTRLHLTRPDTRGPPIGNKPERTERNSDDGHDDHNNSRVVFGGNGAA